MKKYVHLMSINLEIESKSEERPTKEQIRSALEKFLKEDPELENVEWYDTEEEE